MFSTVQKNMLNAFHYYGEKYPIHIGGILYLPKAYKDRLIEAIYHVTSDIELLEYTLLNNTFVKTKQTLVIDELFDISAIQSYFDKPFIEETLLYRIGILIQKDNLLLISVFNHLISDSYSMNLFLHAVLSYISQKEVFEFNNNYDDFVKSEHEGKNTRDFWKNYLENYSLTSISSFPYTKKLFKTTRKALTFSNSESKLIDEFCIKHNVSPAIVFESALSYILSHIHGENNVTYGITSLNRKSAFKQTFGPFIQTLPIKVELKNSISETLKSIQRRHMEVFRHQSVDYKDLLYLNKNEGVLFDALITYHKPLDETYNIPYKYEVLNSSYNDLPLVINIERRNLNHPYIVYFDLSSEIFNDEEERFLKRFKHVLLDIIHEHKITYLLEDEACYYNNQYVSCYRKKQSLIDTIETTLNMYNYLKIYDLNNEMTFEKLNRLRKKFAYKLNKFYEHEEIIELNLDKSIELVIAILGVLTAGKIFTIKQQNKSIYPSISMDFFKDIESYVFLDNKPNERIAVYYTSGTEGPSKKVLLTEDALLNYIENVPFSCNITTKDTILSISNPTFDIFLEDIMLAFIKGTSIVLCDLEHTSQIDKELTYISTTPSVIYHLLEYHTSIFNSVKHIVLGGETLTQNIVNKLKSVSQATIYNTYGPTETTIAVTATKVDKELSIGKPIKNVIVEVRSKNKKRLPFYTLGEITVGGIALADHIDLTGTEEGLRYFTGDYGYIDSKGFIHFLGRRDREIKRRGVRINLEGLDNILNGHPLVKQAVSKYHDGKIISYIDGLNLSKETIYNYLKENLPQTWLPDGIENLNASLSNHGKLKVNRKSIFKPKTKKEKTFLKVVKKVFEIDKLYVEDTFNDIHGTSIKALILIIELEKYGIHISMSNIYNTRYVVELLNHKQNEGLEIDFNNFKLEVNEIIYKEKKPKEVLVLGASGYLGSHLTFELMKQNIRVIAYVRDQHRFYTHYNKYFNESFNGIMIEGHTRELKNKLKSFDIDCVINCIAKVDYVGEARLYEEANVQSVVDILAYVNEINIPLYHISTLGLGINQEDFNETSKIKNPMYDNLYLKSKFMAEYLVLKENIDKVKHHIIRVGNLMPRFKDYKFQINKEENLFMLLLQNAKKTKVLPQSYQNTLFDVSPVDFVSKKIVHLIKYETNMPVYHVFEEPKVTLEEIIGNIHYDKGTHLSIPIISASSKYTNMLLDETKYPKLYIDQTYLKHML